MNDTRGPITAEQRIRLSGSDVSIPRMGMGTWAWGDRETWGYQGYDKELGFEAIRGAWAASIRAGVDLFDTAEVYGDGESERIIGRLRAEDSSLAQRAVIATKFMPYPWRRPFSKTLVQHLRASLERLQVPCVDLYQIHGPIALAPAAALAEPLADVIHARLVKAVGVSNYSEREVRATHAALEKCGVRLATNQVELSLLRRRPETTGLLKACHELDVVVLAYSPLAQGRLTGKYSAQNPPPGRRTFSAHPLERVDRVVAVLRSVGEKHGKTPAQVALNWIMCKGAVPIPGAKNASQAEQNAGALGWRLGDDEVARLDGVSLSGRHGLAQRLLWQHG